MKQKKNIKRQSKAIKDKHELKAKLEKARIEMRAQRKIRDHAKLKKNAHNFVKAKQQVIALKDKIHATKIHIKKAVHRLHNAQAKILSSKFKLQKITGKKVKTAHAQVHNGAIAQRQFTNAVQLRNKLYLLVNRLANNKVVMDYAQTQKGKKASALRLRLTKRIGRLSKRIARKQKEQMRLMKRKHRTASNFKQVYKKMANQAYKLTKADEPKAITTSAKIHVMNLKKKVEKLMQTHMKLHAKKSAIRVKIHEAKAELKTRKDIKKADKKAAKSKAKPTSKKQIKKEKKKAAGKAFKLNIAKLKRQSAKEHRHNLREQDRKVMNQVHVMNKEILRISGQHNKRTSLLQKLDPVHVKIIQHRMEEKVKRAKVAIKKAEKKMKKAKTSKDFKNVAKQSQKLTHQKILLTKRQTRLQHLKKKKLNNPTLKAEHK